MTKSEAIGFIQGKLDCMKKCDTFDCRNSDECDECDYCYAQGTFKKQKEAFQMSIKALEKMEKIKEIIKNWEGGLADELSQILRSDEE